MAMYEIIVDFQGSQDGRFSEEFKAGTVRDLSDYLAAAIDPRWARSVVEKPATPIASPAIAKNPSTETTGRARGRK